METSEVKQLDELLTRYLDEFTKKKIVSTELTTDISKKCRLIASATYTTVVEQTGSKNTKKTDRCYMCGLKYKIKHPNYDTMCNICGEFNALKRGIKYDMKGKIALVTGGRVKIGYYTALSLLRNGARVIATTRFANDALERYRGEDDFSDWSDRLDIVQVSFNTMESVIELIKYVRENYKSLDVIINNAAQTLRRPKRFYEHHVKVNTDHNNNIKTVIDDYMKNEAIDKVDMAVEYNDIKRYEALQNESEYKITTGSTSLVPVPKQLIDKRLMKEYLDKMFPDALYDEHDQQIDMRDINTWTRYLDDIHIMEIMELFTINLLTPFLLVQALHSMIKTGYIINVSSMEGAFNMPGKTMKHPHTNMMKAGLNMFTRTTGMELSNKGIIMVAVDTGWNTIEHPKSYHMKSPIDCIDGAARVLDPIYMELKKPAVFYKNFKVKSW